MQFFKLQRREEIKTIIHTQIQKSQRTAFRKLKHIADGQAGVGGTDGAGGVFNDTKVNVPEENPKGYQTELGTIHTESSACRNVM